MKRLEINESSEFFPGVSTDRHYYIYLDGKESTRDGYYFEDRTFFELTDEFYVEDYPEINSFRIEDFPVDIKFKIKPLTDLNGLFGWVEIYKYAEDVFEITYVLLMREDNEFLVYLNIEFAHHLMNQCVGADFKETEYIFDDVENTMISALEKIYINSEQTLGEIIKHDMDFIYDKIKLVNTLEYKKSISKE